VAIFAYTKYYYAVLERASTIRARTDIRISVLTFLSCASSIITTEYYLKRASLPISLTNIPSVINLNRMKNYLNFLILMVCRTLMSHLISNLPTNFQVTLSRNSLGKRNCWQSSRLRNGYNSALSKPCFIEELGKLSAFSTSGFTTDYCNQIVLYCIDDFCFFVKYWKFFPFCFLFGSSDDCLWI